MGELPSELSSELKRLEKLFTVDQRKLKDITDRFIKELEDGLKENGSNIPMNVAWVNGLPTGKETGAFLTLDMGGTNLRVCKIMLYGQGEHQMTQSEYRIPEELKTGHADELWEYVVNSLEKFLEEHHLEDGPHELGFCFSYPATQDRIDHGVLQTWTKGFDIKGVEGEDVAEQLKGALEKRELPIKLVALANDTTGALMASHYTDPDTVIGAVFGTGCNAAYMEDSSSIHKVKGLPANTLMAINCEYGAFDNKLAVLPRTPYDETIDKESPRPGEQAFEKMSAGLYLGELFRLVMADLHKNGVIFPDQDASNLEKSYSLDTGFLSAVENDESHHLSDTKNLFEEHLDIEPRNAELIFLHRLAVLIGIRGARLSACGIAAICKKRGIQKGHVAADGSVVNKHPKFGQRWTKALGEILDWPERDDEDDVGPVSLTSAEDGSGVGVAVIAALALAKNKSGN